MDNAWNSIALWITTESTGKWFRRRTSALVRGWGGGGSKKTKSHTWTSMLHNIEFLHSLASNIVVSSIIATSSNCMIFPPNCIFNRNAQGDLHITLARVSPTPFERNVICHQGENEPPIPWHIRAGPPTRILPRFNNGNDRQGPRGATLCQVFVITDGYFDETGFIFMWAVVFHFHVNISGFPIYKHWFTVVPVYRHFFVVIVQFDWYYLQWSIVQHQAVKLGFFNLIYDDSITSLCTRSMNAPAIGIISDVTNV